MTAETDRLVDKFTTTLTERHLRALARAELQGQDLDVSPVQLEKLVTRRLRLQTQASRGGQARAKVLTPARRRSIAKRAAAARWSK